MPQLLKLSFAAAAITLLSAFTLGTQTVKIQTTAVCGMCKDRIESVLGAAEGVESVRLDLTTKKVKIKFDDAKQSVASLRMLISSIGYAADDVDANLEAYDELPGCCQGATSCSADEKGGNPEH